LQLLPLVVTAGSCLAVRKFLYPVRWGYYIEL
jgi:hypothetical protein